MKPLVRRTYPAARTAAPSHETRPSAACSNIAGHQVVERVRGHPVLARLAAPALGEQGVQLTGAETRPVRQQDDAPLHYRCPAQPTPAGDQVLAVQSALRAGQRGQHRRHQVRVQPRPGRRGHAVVGQLGEGVRQQHVGQHALARALRRQRPAEGQQLALAGRVGGQPDVAVQPAGGADQDDPAVAGRAQHRHRGPGQPDATLQVDLEHLAELRGRLLVEHAARADRRVGHADVQPPPALNRRRDDRLPAGRVGRVGVLGHRLAARSNDFRCHVVGGPAAIRVRAPVAVVDHDLRAVPGQRQAERAAEPPPAAGHHRHPPGQRRVIHDPSSPIGPNGPGSSSP